VENLTTFAEQRNKNFFRYLYGIKSNMLPLKQREGDFISSFAFPVVNNNREKIVEQLQLYGVEVRPLIAGSIGRQPFWMKVYGEKSLYNADMIHRHGFYLPNHTGLSEKDIDYIIDIVNKNS
jgi:CDP-6-deoxy-D-xylo-4-hexulose-3-dehydrase